MAVILLVEDDALVRRMVARVLAGAGHSVIEAADGRTGLAQFRAHAPELVLTDLVMPDMEGIALIREIRSTAAAARIVAMSTGGSSRDQALYLDMARKLGADASIAKPFRPAELLALITALLPEPR